MRRTITIFMLLFLLACVVDRFRLRYASEELRLVFFDVGQGDSALVEFPGGKTLLIDAGGGTDSSDVGSRVLVPELTRRGILAVDYALLTHTDRDHALGFRGLMERIFVREYWLSQWFADQELRAPLLNLLLAEARYHGSRWRLFQGRTQVREGDAVLTLFQPPVGDRKTNNHCLVTLLEFGTCRVLFTGDIESKAELSLLKDLPKVDLLKVAHHGSKTSTSSAFLKGVSPQWAVISAGVENTYGHPVPFVVERLTARGIQIFRTDVHGYVKFAIDRHGKVSCTSSLGSCGEGFCRDAKREIFIAPHY